MSNFMNFFLKLFDLEYKGQTYQVSLKHVMVGLMIWVNWHGMIQYFLMCITDEKIGQDMFVM